MKLKTVLAIFTLLVGLAVVTPALAYSAPVDEVASELVCQCGCGLVLANCNHSQCPSRDNMTATIRQQIDEGRSNAEIIQFFVDSYGEQVLAAPLKRGFNLVAWLSPFVALLVGGGAIYIALRAWVRRGKRFQSDWGEAKDEEKYRRKLEEELKEFMER